MFKAKKLQLTLLEVHDLYVVLQYEMHSFQPVLHINLRQYNNHNNCKQIRRELLICSHLLKNSVMKILNLKFKSPLKSKIN